MTTPALPIWTVTLFDALGPRMLYDLMALRQTVFVVEQQCAYLDCDGVDLDSLHLCGELDGTLVAYARLVPPGRVFEEASIGRVVTARATRRLGYGRLVMNEAIAQSRVAFGHRAIRIGAQRYLERFYSSLGFVSLGDPYVEDGIAHVHMLLLPAGR